MLVETVNVSGSQLNVSLQYDAGASNDNVSVYIPYGPTTSKVLSQSFSGVIAVTTTGNDVTLHAYSNNLTMYIKKVSLTLIPI